MEYKKIAIGIFCVVISLAVFLISKQVEPQFPTGYFIGVSVSIVSLLIGFGLLIPPIAYVLKEKMGGVSENRFYQLLDRMKADVLSKYGEELRRSEKMREWERKNLADKTMYRGRLFSERVTGDEGLRRALLWHMVDSLGGDYQPMERFLKDSAKRIIGGYGEK